jgi:hypothetical protein
MRSLEDQELEIVTGGDGSDSGLPDADVPDDEIPLE